MLVKTAGALAAVALGLAIYSELTDDAVAKALGFLVGAIVLALFGWKLKSILSNAYVETSNEGFGICLWVVVVGCFAVLFVVVAIRRLQAV